MKRVLMMLGLLLLACGSDDSKEGGSGGSGGSATCTSELTPGTQTLTIEHGGQTREYIAHVPASYTGQTRVPLVMNFHGFTSNSQQQELFSAMDAKADAEGFIVVYPQGLLNPDGTNRSWNAGVCCAFNDTSRDDLGFTRAVVKDVSSKACIDSHRIYSTGMSNGGFMSHFLACKAADLFAAVAPVAGPLGIPPAECQPSRPIPIIHFHGTADSLAQYAGVPDMIAGWATRNGCQPTPQQTYSQGAATCQTYSGCNAGVEVTLCSIEGEGHCWPGQTVCPFGASTTDISANDEMWKVFTRFPLP